MSGTHELDRWIEEVSGPEWIWHAKFLSANDTYAKPNVHQGGPYIGKELLASAFPEISARVQTVSNPEHWLHAQIDSDGWADDVRLVWYNSRVLEDRPNGRDEARITHWQGRSSPLMEPDATGSLVVFAFRRLEKQDSDLIRIWVTRDSAETERILELVGDVEPGRPILWSPAGALPQSPESVGPCALDPGDLPREWVAAFPTGEHIVEWVLQNRPAWASLPTDGRLVKRIECEYQLFRSIESEHVLPRARVGFESVDLFVQFANAVTNRRKARAGRSLELQTRAILREEDVPHSWAPFTEGVKRPDFIFPSAEKYHDPSFPGDRLRMLGAKTTCKDRWRQILNEADRVPKKHLLTLQEGVSENQFREMRESDVLLVVPDSLTSAYPESVQPELISLEKFIGEAKDLFSE